MLLERFSALGNFDHVAVEKAFRDLIEELQLKAKVLIHPLRAAVTGMLAGPGIFEVLAVLGKERSCERIRRAIAIMKDIHH